MKIILKISRVRPKSLNILRRRYSNDASNVIKKREGFGSFHSEDIEVLIQMSDKEYQYPVVYDEINSQVKQNYPWADFTTCLYGKKAKEKYFHLDLEYNFINHGAFGASLRHMVYEANLWRVKCETQPLIFFDRILLPMIAFSTREIARFIGCSQLELFPLPNVTTGINAVVNCIDIQPNDNIVCFSLTYGSTKKILKEVCGRKSANYHEIELSFPITLDMILSKLKSSLIKLQDVKVIIIDQITSNSAFNMPIIELTNIIRKIHPNALVVIDGAHGLLTQDLDLNFKTNFDIWITNCHKWFCSPKGAAYMWISPRCKNKIRPLVISHGWTNTEKLMSGFSWDGCRDYSSLLSIPNLIRFWNQINYQDMRSRNFYLLKDANEILMKEWNLTIADYPGCKKLQYGSPMILVCYICISCELNDYLLF